MKQVQKEFWELTTLEKIDLLKGDLSHLLDQFVQPANQRMVKGFAKRKHFEQVVNNQLAGILQSKDHLATEQSQKEQILNALRSFVIDEVSSEYIGEINRRL